MSDYKKRMVDNVLLDKLEAKGAVLIEGPKWCGKTTTALQFSNSVIRVDDPNKREINVKLAQMEPSRLLEGETPRLIDEWQIAPKLWDAARYEIDIRSKEGQFIFTGSAVPIETDEITHSGTGRFAFLAMRTMSLYESEESTGEVRLGELFDKPKKISGFSELDLEKIAFLVCRGGWPKAIGMGEKAALMQGEEYFEAVVRSDINRADGVKKDKERVKRLMKSYARNQGTQATYATLRGDIEGSDSEKLSDNTVAYYLAALRKIFVVEDMAAWNPNLRSKEAIRTSDTRYYTDPSIAAAALEIGPKDLFNDLNTFGLLFETMCIRDLRVYAQANSGEVYHYRDKSGLECDAVIHLKNGRYGLAEIKLGGEKSIEEGVNSLKAIVKKLDIDRMKEPAFLMVVVGVGGYAYVREDGVYVVPIGCLKN